MRLFIKYSFLLIFFLLITGISAAAQSYPAAWPNTWVTYTRLGNTIDDLQASGGDTSSGGTGINPNSIDVFNGTAGNLPSVYYQYDPVNLVIFFRMRLLGDPRTQGGNAPFDQYTWNAVLDTDGDGFKEFFVEVNGQNDFIEIYYGDTNSQSIPNGSTCATNGQGRVFAQAITYGSHARVIDETATGGGYLLDFQAPLSGFVRCNGTQGLTGSTPFSMVFTTSTTAQNPTQKDLVGAGNFTMTSTSQVPGGDLITLDGSINSAPAITNYSQICSTGASASPVTLTATTLDTLLISPTGAVIDTIANVTFSYQQTGTSTWTQIGSPLTTPVSGTVNQWRTFWNTSSLSATTYQIRVVVIDDQGNTTTDTSHSINLATCNAVTYVDLISFTASHANDRTLLEWKTGFEADNLGFNIYREEAGKRSLVNSQLIAGSALTTGIRTVLQSGESYLWWDKAQPAGAVYWLEDLDLNGQSRWHGPFSIQAAADPQGFVEADRPVAKLLHQINQEGGPSETSQVVERFAALALPKRLTLAQASAQSLQASQPAIKISVKQEGWYRVTQAELLRAGLDPNSNPGLFQLSVDGREVPVRVSTGKDGRFDETSAIEFYGFGLNTASTNVRTYWLTVGSQAGLRVQLTRGGGSPGSAAGFVATIERRDRTIYFSSLRNGEQENFFGAVVAANPVNQELRLTNLDTTAGGQAVLEVAIQGVTQVAHRVAVQINGFSVGDILFSGQQAGVNKFTLQHSLLKEGINTVQLVALNSPSDINLVDYIRLSYQHRFRADDDSLKLRVNGKERVTITGFTSRAIRVFDVSSENQVTELTGDIVESGQGFAVTVTPAEAGQRTLLALADDRKKPAAGVKANLPSNWRDPNQGANLIILTAKDFKASFESLKAARQSEGYQVALVDIEDVYDEFAFGQKSPQAIKDFLAYAKSNWKLQPAYLLLAADASYDAKNYTGQGDFDFVPTKLIDTTFLETASDDWFADFNNDGISDIAVGRLPIRTPAEAERLVTKLLNYGKTIVPQSALLVSDANDEFNFEQASSQLRSLVAASLSVEELRRGQVDPAAAKQQLLDAINRGQKLVNYAGHGSINLWRGNLLTAEDARALSNRDRLPMFVLMTCLNGYFHDPGLDSLGESLLKAENGGAVAVWASSAQAEPDPQSVVNQEFYRQLSQSRTIGEAIMKAKNATADRDLRRTWILLGDPTMKLR
jgi:hypothetical protein